MDYRETDKQEVYNLLMELGDSVQAHAEGDSVYYFLEDEWDGQNHIAYIIRGYHQEGIAPRFFIF